jgi:Right handed beta helix region
MAMLASMLLGLAVVAGQNVGAASSMRENVIDVKSVAQLQAAFDSAGPGDTIQLAPGVYRLTEWLRITQSGRPEAWIKLKGPDHGEAILDASAIKAKSEGEAGDNGALTLKGVSHWHIQKITVQSSPGFGVYVQKGSSHIDLQDNKVDLTYGPGIGVWNSSQIRVVGNEVVAANAQRMRQHGSRQYECPHEAISIAGVNGFEVAFNHVHHVMKEGIDVKEISQNGVVHHNYVHNLPRQAYYADAWFGLLQNVVFHSNIAHDAEWGMVISVEGAGSELKNVQFVNNLLYRLRGSGLYFGTWGGNGPRSGIRFEYNTVFNAGNPTHWSGPTGGIDLRADNFRDVVVRRNLVIGGASYQIATPFAPAERERKMTAVGLVIDANWVDEYVDETGHKGLYNQPYAFPHVGQKSGPIRFEEWRMGDFSFAPESEHKPIGYGAFHPEAEKASQFKSFLKGFPVFTPKPDGLHPVLARKIRAGL